MIKITDKVKDPKLANHEDDEMPEGEDVQDRELEEQEEAMESASRQYEQHMYQSASNDYSITGNF